ncbi:MAG: Uma2 family endonuclease [Bryobacteraceae bacterium]
MSVETLVSVERYLNTCYDPDLEYVDGTRVERNVGDWLHSLIQSNIIFALRTGYPHLKVVPELRSQTTATRFRLPDVTVVWAVPVERYLRRAAFIAVEILSEADRMSAVMEKLHEYEAHGIPNIWVIGPRLQQMSVFHSGTLEGITGDALRSSQAEVELTRAEIFQS